MHLATFFSSRSAVAIAGLLAALLLGLIPTTAHAQNPGEPGVVPVPEPELVLRLRADQGVTGTTEVTEWLDQSGSGNDAGLTSLAGPEFVSSLAGMNNQPALLFDRANSEGMNVADTDDINGDGNGTIQYATRTITLAFQTGSDVNTRQILYEEGGGTNGFNVYIESGSVVASAWSESQGWAQHFSISETVTTNTAYITTFVFDKDAPNQLEFFANGTSAGTVSDPSITFMNEHVGDIGIGNVIEATQFPPNDEVESADDGTEGFSGHVAEVILSNDALNTAQRQILESDLSERYGITIANDRYGFITPLGEIRGIGQAPDGTRQTEASSGLVSFANPTLANGDFALIAHNENAESLITDIDPSGIGERLDRVWRYDSQGSPTFDLDFDVSGLPALASGQSYQLLVENDETFTSGASVVSGTLSGSTFTVPSSALSDGAYFTLARTATTGPSSLTYAPNPLEELESNIGAGGITATPTVGGVTGSVNGYSISAGSDADAGGTPVSFGPNDDATTQDVEIDPSTGEITVTDNAPVGEYTATVEVEDDAGPVTFTDVLTIAVQQQVAISYGTPSQTVVVDGGTFEPIQAITQNAPSIQDGSVTYSLSSGDDLTAVGLLFDTSTGQISGTPTRRGIIRTVVRVDGSGAAVGADSTEINIAVVGGDGPAGIGDDVSTILDLDASALSAVNGDDITTWTDVSNYGNDASAAGGVDDPTYVGSATGLNGRPALDFPDSMGSDPSVLALGDTPEFNDAGNRGEGGSPFVQRSLAVAFRTGGDLSGTTPEGIYAEGGGTRGLSVYVRDGDLYVGMWNENADDETGPWGPYFFSAEDNTSDGGTGTVSIDANTAYLVTFTYDYAASSIEAYVNGTLIGTQTTGVGRFFDHNEAAIGGFTVNEGSPVTMDFDGGEAEYDGFTGQIAEVVAYGVALTDAQRQILESSLGAKYGIATTNNRFDFAASEEFDSGLNVVGVGRLSDNPAAHDPAVTSSELTATPSVSLTDGDFTVLGHDDSTAVFAAEPEVGDYQGTGGNAENDVSSRLVRTWRVDVTGTAAFDYGDLAIDVSGFSLGTGQNYVLLADTDDSFTGSATVIEGSVSGTTFTPDKSVTGSLSTLSDASYITLGRTQGVATGPTTLTYSPNPLRVSEDATTSVDASPTVDGQPTPTFSILSGGAAGISIDASSGVLTVDPTTVAQGTYAVQIEATNSGGSITETVDVEIFTTLDAVTYANGVQTVSDGEAVANITPSITPGGISDGTITYSLQRVVVNGSVQGDLSGTGLSLETDGSVTGTPDQLGTVALVIEATGSDGAGGTVTTDVKVTAVGNTGIAGIGDNTTTLLQLTSDDLASFGDGDPVPSWPDASGYGNDADQVASAEQPLLESDATASLNDAPVLRFDGTDDELEIADAVSLNAGDDGSGEPYLQRALSFVVRTGSNVSDRQVIYEEGGGTRGFNAYVFGGDLYVAAWNNADDALVGGGTDPTTPWENDTAGDGFVFVQNGVSTNTAYVVSLFYDYATGTVEMWVNGESVGSASGAGRQYDHGGDIAIGANTDGTFYETGQSGAGPSEFFTGDVAAASFTDASLNETQRTLLHNALGATYAIGLSTNATDVYAGDETGNGDYDLGVFGIGQTSVADRHTSASFDGLQFDLSSGLDDGDYLVAGHRSDENGVTSDDVSGVTGLDVRMDRTWYVDQANDSGGSITIDVTIDLSDAGLSGIAGTASDYVLLERGADATSGTNWNSIATGASTANTDQITFTGVTLTDGNEITLGTTDQVASPLGGAQIVLRGTAGNEGSVDDLNPNGGDAGFVLLGPPESGGTYAGLASDTDPQLIEFDLPGPMIYSYNASTDAWEEVTSGQSGDALTSGEGFLLYVFDDLGSDDADPIDPTLPITISDGTGTPTTDVTRSGLGTGDQWVFLANPFGVPFDVTALTANGTGTNGMDEYSTTLQAWDDDGSTWISGLTLGTPGTGETNTAGVGQGFFLECTSIGSCPTEVTLPTSGRVTGDRDVIGHSATTGETPQLASLRLQMDVTEGAGSGVDTLATDRAARILFYEAATAGWDRYDASKLAPFLAEYATLTPMTPSGDTMRAAAQASLPYPTGGLTQPVEVPLAVTPVGVSGTATVSAAAFHQLPEGWGVELIDTRGTADPSDDVITPWVPGASYSFDLSPETSATLGTVRAEATQVNTEGRAAWRPGALRLDQTPEWDAAQEAPPEALEQSASSESTSSSEPAPTRLVLRITPDSTIPVELAGMSATTADRTVRLDWQTASETNNAGFHVEHQRLAIGDTSATPTAAGWKRLGYVEGNGTTTAPQSYRFETGELEYGRHVFRLTQVDTDGTATATAPVETTIELQDAYAIGAPYPNPARGQTTLPITVRETQPVTVEVYDVLGRRVAVPFQQAVTGQQTKRVQLRTDGLGSGVYFVRIRGEAFATTRRMTVVR